MPNKLQLVSTLNGSTQESLLRNRSKPLGASLSCDQMPNGDTVKEGGFILAHGFRGF